MRIIMFTFIIILNNKRKIYKLWDVQQQNQLNYATDFTLR